MEEKISAIEHINEKIGFGLRMKKGFNIKDFPERYQKIIMNNIENAQEKYPDCLKTKSYNVTFTQKGMLHLDELIPSILL
tara:strand:+ start:799 stop:1038 length:240 start_codon:yes stop_codon:yes gene_type:complete